MRTITGDITNVPTTGNQYIVHSCNAQGKIGYGVSTALMNKWPPVRYAYLSAYREGRVHVDTYHNVSVDTNIVVVNAILQEHYRGSVPANRRMDCHIDYEAVESVFSSIVEQGVKLHGKNNFTINVPMIGAGLGNADWDTVSSTIEYVCSGKCDMVYWKY